MEETDLYKSLEHYYANYKPEDIIIKEKRGANYKYIQVSILALLLGGGIYLYTK